MASLLAHSIRLPLVLRHAGVDGPAKPLASCWHCSRRLELAYWTISGRIGAEKTCGSGWEASPALPSAEMMETVGLLVMLAVVLVVAEFRGQSSSVWV
jgi:hypothetical protein